MEQKIPVGTVWSHRDTGGNLTIWRVCTPEECGSPETNFKDQDIYLRLLYTNSTREGTVKAGSAICYWSESMLQKNRWVQVEEDEVPMLILGEV